MTETASKNEKIKLALIPLLGLVLLYSLMTGEDTVVSPSIELIRQRGESPNRDGSNTGHSNRSVLWPERSLHAIVGHNPFELIDPRAVLDAEFARNGITAVTRMTAINAAEFFEDIAASAGDDGELGLAAADSENPAGIESAADIAAMAAAEMQRARIEDLQQRIRKLQDTPVTMIMTTVRGTSALLGERNIVEGELLEAGIRAVFIRRDGITFELVDDTTSR
ncbi:MAG TPA: hypothetical protein EYG03_22290 [Planctomycetes bacterium]|nr:hypothetical protein [Fuerstiella sp.]HIK94683.1 hypothetical protein [Planctomycetota bacterium]